MSSHETSSTDSRQEAGHTATAPMPPVHAPCDETSCQQFWCLLLRKEIADRARIQADLSSLHTEHEAVKRELDHYKQHTLQLEKLQHEQIREHESLKDECHSLVANLATRDQQLDESIKAQKQLKEDLDRVNALNEELIELSEVQRQPAIQVEQTQDKDSIRESQTVSNEKSRPLEAIIHTIIEHTDQVLLKISDKISTASRDLGLQNKFMKRCREDVERVFTEVQQTAAETLDPCPHDHSVFSSTLTKLKKALDLYIAAQYENFKRIKSTTTDLGEDTISSRKKLFNEAAVFQESAGCRVIKNPLDDA